MSAKLVRFPDAARVGCYRDLRPSRVLKGAAGARLAHVTIVGTTIDGEDHIASTYANPADALWDLEYAKLWLLRGPPE